MYSSYSFEVVFVMLEYLLNALDSSNSVDHVDDSKSAHNTEYKQTAYDEWKSVVLKLSRKEPEFLLTLTQAVLEKMETHKAPTLEIGFNQSPENSAKSRQIELLSTLFQWLVSNLKTLNHVTQKESVEAKDSTTDKHLPKAILVGLIQGCLLVSSPVNERLMAAALDLAHLSGDIPLLQKLKKLALLWSPAQDTSSLKSCNKTLLSQQEDFLDRAEEKFELIIRRRQKQNRKENSVKSDVGVKSKWALAKSWNPCPIGMLPHTFGFSGQIPVLDCIKVVKLSDNEENCEVIPCGKREAEIGIEEIDNTFVKKAKETEVEYSHYQDEYFEEGIKGRLVIDGMWRRVGEEELLADTSSVRSLV